MRIGLVIEHFDPRRGGAEQWTCQFAATLAALGHEVHVLARGFEAAHLRVPIVPHTVEGAKSRLAFAAESEKLLRRLNLDVIHDMGCGWYCDVLESHDGSRLAQWERKLARLPSWARPVKRALLQWLPRYREFRELMQRQYAEPGPLVLALSRTVAADYQRWHQVRPERIRLVYNGVDIRRFSPTHRKTYREAVRGKLGVEPAETLLLFVGHDFDRKGLGTAIEALGRLKEQKHAVKLAVVGGRKPGSYAAAARRCGVADEVLFVGSADDSVPYYAAADIFVLPTYYDPCSLSVLEAAASGVPCVTTRVNGAGELLTDGVDGALLDDPADAEALAAVLLPLLDPTQQQAMGEAARQLAMQHTFAHNCSQILEIYRQVARTHLHAA